MMPGAVPEGVVEAVLESIGESDAMLGGSLYTFLTSVLNPTDTTINVESTHQWPSSGKVRVGREVIEYEGKTTTTILAISRDPRAVVHYPGEIAWDASRLYSEVDSLRSQLVYPTATGTYLEVLLRNHGLSVVEELTEDQLRAYGEFASYPPAGPVPIVAEFLGLVLPGQLRYGSCTAPNTITLDGTLGGWPTNFDVTKRLVRILAPSDNAGLYRVDSITGLNATLVSAAGMYWDAGNALVTEVATVFELIRWDVWEKPNEPGKFRVDLLEFSGPLSSIKGAAYLQGGEEGVSTTVLSVPTIHTIQNVLGVWLRGDVERAGTNYYTGGTFAGNVITLGSALPSATEPVLIDYGAATYTAQVLEGPSIDGTYYYAFYLSDPSAAVAKLLEVIRAAGFLPVLSYTVL